MRQIYNSFLLIMIIFWGCGSSEKDNINNVSIEKDWRKDVSKDSVKDVEGLPSSKDDLIETKIEHNDKVLLEPPLIVHNLGVNNLVLGSYLRNIVSETLNVKDTLIEEEATWRGKAIFSKNHLLFIAEANWKNDSIVSR
ncbi:MAG: hypothetical protein ACK4ND_17300, partial [Cytophagaceae bacterium]